MFQVVEADTADELWLKAAAWFESDGFAMRQGSRCGNTIEVLHGALSLSDPRQRWIASRAPAINPAYALAEVIWIINGRNDSAMPNYFNQRLPKYAGGGSTYHGAYGFRLRQHFGLDQLQRAYLALSANSESRQIVLQFWDCTMDLPTDQGDPGAADIPCNVISILKLREGRLEWTQIMRSNDFVLGLPHNIVQFTCLQEVMAGWLGVQLGGFNHYADSLHIYDRDEAIADRIDSCSLPRNNESIALPKVASERSFVNLGTFADVLASSVIDVAELLTAFDELEVDPSLRSWAAVLTADALRRRDARREMETVMNGCSNPCLAMLFERWLQRKSPS